MTRTDFIEEYPGALSPEACAALVARFESSGQATPGRAGGGTEPDREGSRDIHIAGRAEWRDAELQLNGALLKALVAYVRKYPYVLLSILNFDYPDPKSGQVRRMRGEDLSGLPEDKLVGMLRGVTRAGPIKLQCYQADEGSYLAWHCEAAPSPPGVDGLHRALMWLLFLNDGYEGGETEFLYQERKIVPRAGTLLLAPTSFVHTWRGHRPLGGDQYLASSWVMYQRYEDIIRR